MYPKFQSKVKPDKPYQKAVLGGTFDRLHEAHILLLRTANFIAEEIYIGIVGKMLGKNLFLNKQYREIIQPYSIRKNAIKEYLKKIKANYIIEELKNPWGPAPNDREADVIVVSNETKTSANYINKMRRENGLNLLDIFIIPWIWTPDNTLISSTRLRIKEIERKKVSGLKEEEDD